MGISSSVRPGNLCTHSEPLNSSRQSNSKDRAAIGRVGSSERAAVFGDDSMSQGQSDPVASGFGCEEGDENLLQVSDRNAVACVLDRDCCPLLALLGFT